VPPPSRLDTEVFRALEKTQAVVYPGAVTVPTMLTGATDMGPLRAKGVQAYGTGGPELENEPLAHGNDERISVDGFGKYVEFIYRTVIEVAASAPPGRK
jgi:acetylornithine deacetylase/succinyl-diaminopimelate desuccinylase-like protein